MSKEFSGLGDGLTMVWLEKSFVDVIQTTLAPAPRWIYNLLICSFIDTGMETSFLHVVISTAPE